MKYKLTLLPDGDIEICEEKGKCIFHKSYNLGDNLKENLINAFSFLCAVENPNSSKGVTK